METCVRCFGSTFWIQVLLLPPLFSVNPVWLEPRITCIFSEKQSFVISAFGTLFPLTILFNLRCLGLPLCKVYIYVYSRECIREESKEE